MKDHKMAAANDKSVDQEKGKGTVETMERRTIQAKYFFTEKEKVDLAGKMAQRQLELVEKEDEKKTAMAGFTDTLKRIKLDISRFSRSYRDGWEHRDFEVVVVMDYKRREKKFKDVHSGKIVDTQPFGPGDEQRKFL